MLKVPYFRSRPLLDLARVVPHCMSCLRSSDGSIVACHSNNSFDGKGAGIKAKDYRIFYGCSLCHHDYDGGPKTRSEKQYMFEQAHRNTIEWLFDNNHLKVVT